MTDMLEDERIYRAHLALHGQPLLIEWMARAVQLRRAAQALVRGLPVRDGYVRLYQGANDAWVEAVRREYGQLGSYSKLDGSYCVGGHTYANMPMLGDPT